MDLKELSIEDKADIEFVERLYIESFPLNERRPISEMLKLLHSDPSFHILLLTEDSSRVGFITYWTFETFTFAEHFAISPEFRNGGYGKKAIEGFVKLFANPLLIEVELPETEIAKRRIGFYQRLGFKVWDIPYCQPPYEEKYNDIPMLLMTYREFDLLENFEATKAKLYKKVYKIETE